MSTISAGTTTTTALVSTGDTTGNLVLQTGTTPTTALTLDSTTQAATFAGTLATASRGITKASMPTGSILQVISTPKTDTFSTTSTSFSDITGLSVSITPTAASSKILIIVGLSLGATEASYSAQPRLMRDATAIFVSDAAGSRTQAAMMYELGAAASIPTSIVFLDSPSTTSATTYKMQLRSNTGGLAAYVNRGVTDTDISAFARSVSSITVMEIAA
jgi:hypothetical protein